MTPAAIIDANLAEKGRYPRNDTLAKILGVTVEEAQKHLDRHRKEHGERVRNVQLELPIEEEKPKRKRWTIEDLVIGFSHELQYIGFFVATAVDLALCVFFFYSLGSGDLGKAILGLLGLVLLAAKLWGWSYSKIDRKAFSVAVFTVALSVFGNTAILRAEFELQAKMATSANTESTSKQSTADVLQKQIKEKQDEIEKKVAARDSIDLKIETNLPMYNTIDKKVKESNKELTELKKQLDEAERAHNVIQVEVKQEDKPLQIDAWSVFRQWTEIEWTNAPRTLAYFFTLFVAILPDLIIYATTPRKRDETNT